MMKQERERSLIAATEIPEEIGQQKSQAAGSNRKRLTFLEHVVSRRFP